MEEYSENVLKTRKHLMKYFTNAFTHNLILWIISKETIHGYGIMKKIDQFFSTDDDFKTSSSKVYPLLRRMEQNGLIIGEWRINENNKRVKYYSITQDGETVLYLIKEKFNTFRKNPYWLDFMTDISDLEVDK